MAKEQSDVLARMKAKKVVLDGKFGFREEERFEALTEAHGGTVERDIDKTIDFLVVAELAGSKTVQKKMQALNAKGATIQLMDAAKFGAMVALTDELVVALIRRGTQSAEIIGRLMQSQTFVRMYGAQQTVLTIIGENFDGVDMSGMMLGTVAFEGCSFVGAKINNTMFGPVRNCDFSRSEGTTIIFNEIDGGSFAGAKISGVGIQSLLRCDFTGAEFEKAKFSRIVHRAGGKSPVVTAAGFSKSVMKGAQFQHMNFKEAVFEGANLAGAAFLQSAVADSNCRNMNLEGATLIGCEWTGCDLRGANLRGANLAETDLTGSRLDGAELAGCNLRGAKLDGVDLSKAKNFTPPTSGTIGPALTELTTLAQAAQRIQIEFRVASPANPDGETLGIDTVSFRYGFGVSFPFAMGLRWYGQQHKPITFNDAMMRLANVMGHHEVRFETVEVSSTKSPKTGKELRELVLQGITEAFGQPLPPSEELAAATKSWRDATREKDAVSKHEREKRKEEAEKAREKEKKKAEKAIEKKVGKVTDVATFLKALELRIEKPKIDKATKMLKASGFQLFNDVGDKILYGVVKSQSDADLVYACRMDAEGHYACCTQNLNVCGGLRGSICKHLLVLIIGLVQAGTLDPTTIDDWVKKSATTKPELDKEKMGEIFIRYKGAEAGEVDWRPTETVPEDYYTL